MAERVGPQIGNYRLVRLLGRGGFAEVYLGEHLRLKTLAAIKVLHTHLTDKDVEGFLTEARIIAHLEHPNIVRILDFDVQEGLPFLVMSYVPNGTLRQRHPKGTLLPLPTLVSYIKQIAAALQYAHDEKLIHRDIKPDNMLLGSNNTVLLGDFGIAVESLSSRDIGAQGIAGTIAYMAPEQIQGKPRRASDQYALGVVVYEWLSGDRPFYGSFTEVATQHLLAPPPPLHEKIPTIPPDVEQVVLTALAKDPQQRFATVQAFATALQQACQSEPSPILLSQPVHAVILSSQSLASSTLDSAAENSQLLARQQFLSLLAERVKTLSSQLQVASAPNSEEHVLLAKQQFLSLLSERIKVLSNQRLMSSSLSPENSQLLARQQFLSLLAERVKTLHLILFAPTPL